MVNQLRTAEGDRVIINIDNYSSDFLRNVKVSSPHTQKLDRGAVGMLVEAMMVEGLPIMKERNNIFISRVLHKTSEGKKDPYAWYRTVLGQRLEKVV